MKVSLNWLSDYVDVSIRVDDLCKLLTRIGLNVEGTIEAGDDLVIDLEVTSNRSDCLGHLGVAREIAAATGKKFSPPVIDETPESKSERVEDFAEVQVLDEQLCPRYTARVIRDVKIGPSPDWLVQKLQAVGIRSVNNVVDITNYVLMEYSQPLHCFDLDKLSGSKIIVRPANAGEKMVSIDETECKLDQSMLVIADAEKPVAIAGIMGGLTSEVGPETTNLLIESAQFDPLSIRKTSRKLALMSESNYRFERGVDPVAVNTASMRACQLILELAGGQLAKGVLDVWAKPHKERTVSLRCARCSSLLGVDIPAKKQAEVLDALGLDPKLKKDTIACTIPPYRADLTREVDLIEEVARIVGYNNIPVGQKVTHPVKSRGQSEDLRNRITRVLSAVGFDEAITFTFVDSDQAQMFGHPNPVCVDRIVRKTNNALRPTLLASLLKACKANQDAGNIDVALYELAAVFIPTDTTLPQEQTQLAMVTTGDLRSLRGAVEAIVGSLAPAGSITVAEDKITGFADGTAVRIAIDGQQAGVIGKIAENVREAFDLERAITAATINFQILLDASKHRQNYKPIPKFPSVQRDLSFIVDERVKWFQLAEAIGSIDQPQRASAEYVTTYRGEPIDPGKKSITVTLVYRSDESTLRGETVDQYVTDVVSALSAKFSAQLRK